VVFIEDFLLYIKNNYGCSHNTAMKFVQRFRTVVNFAKNTGLVTADPFGSYRVRFERTDRDYLTMEEITTLFTTMSLTLNGWSRYVICSFLVVIRHFPTLMYAS
jgi:hypothetical protein